MSTHARTTATQLRLLDSRLHAPHALAPFAQARRRTTPPRCREQRRAHGNAPLRETKMNGNNQPPAGSAGGSSTVEGRRCARTYAGVERVCDSRPQPRSDESGCRPWTERECPCAKDSGMQPATGYRQQTTEWQSGQRRTRHRHRDDGPECVEVCSMEISDAVIHPDADDLPAQ